MHATSVRLKDGREIRYDKLTKNVCELFHIMFNMGDPYRDDSLKWALDKLDIGDRFKEIKEKLATVDKSKYREAYGNLCESITFGVLHDKEAK